MNTKIETSLSILGIRPFRVESCYALDNAQRNLAERSHYADKETLRYFKARILDAYTAKENLVFWLIESNNSKPFEPKKNKRFICFDIFGTVLNERDEWFSTSKAADNARKTFLESFDAVAHTEKRLHEIAVRDAENAQTVFNALAGI